MRWLLFIIILILYPALLPGQSLPEARQLQQAGELEAARHMYATLVREADPEQAVQILTAWSKLALEESNLSEADSVLQQAEAYLEDSNTVSLASQLRLQTARGEYFRANSQYAAAKQQHLEVLRASSALPDSTLIEAYARFYLALTWEKLTEYDSSLVYADQAYASFQSWMEPDDIRFSTIYNGLGACYFRANQLEKAESFFRRAARLAELHFGPASPDRARCLNNLSTVLRMREEYRPAVAIAEEALEIFRHRNDLDGMAGTYYSLAIYQYYLGDYGRATQYLQQCISIRERLFHQQHASLIGPYELLVVVLEAAGRYERMLPLLQRARRIIQANYPPGSVLEGFNYENTANAYISLDQLDSAMHYANRAHQILPQVLPANDYALGVHYYIYADILRQAGDYRQAADYLQESNRIYLRLGLENSAESAQNQVLGAQIALAGKNWPEAERLFAQAMNQLLLPQTELYRATPDALIVLKAYAEFQFQRYRQGQAPDALERFSRTAANYQRISQQVRQQFTDPYTRSILAKNNAQAYRSLIGMYAHLYQQSGSTDYLESIYTLSEYSRAARLRDLQDLHVNQYAHLPDSLLHREQALRQEVVDAQVAFLENPESPENRAAFFEARDSLQAHIAFLQKHHPSYYALRFQHTLPACKEWQQMLSPQAGMIQFTRDDSLYYALLITPDKISFHQLAACLEVDATIQDWRIAMQRQSPEIREIGARLYQLLWAPLADHIPGQDVTIAPVGALFYLNFECLPAPDGHFLIDRHAMSYTPALSLLQANPNRPQATGAGLAVAPGFTDDVKAAYLQQEPPLDQHFLKAVRQPWSLALARRLQRTPSFRVLTGSAATEERVRDQLPNSRLIYLGTHAVANADDPLRSYLLLSKGTATDTTDGYLYAYEWYNIPLQADLAILHACESGIGALETGEGMISLAHSIHYAGCPSTALSLWKVDEKTSTQITEDFILYLRQGLTKRQALRQAKLDFLERSQALLSHPFYWGGMILMGQDGAIYEADKTWPQWWHLLPLVLIIGSMLWLQLRKTAKGHP